MERPFLRFLVTGGIAALINFGSRIVYSLWLSYPVAVILAYLTGMVAAFVMARLYVFTETDHSIVKSAGWFAVVNVVGAAQTLGVSLLLADWVLPGLGVDWQVETLAHGLGVMAPVFSSYLGHKHLSFRVAVS
ncbi:MAG: hypothetical protein NVS3B1_17950 [Marmoricola sp.]